MIAYTVFQSFRSNRCATKQYFPSLTMACIGTILPCVTGCFIALGAMSSTSGFLMVKAALKLSDCNTLEGKEPEAPT
eukprot:153801-Amphidinium_carterae.1